MMGCRGANASSHWWKSPSRPMPDTADALGQITCMTTCRAVHDRAMQYFPTAFQGQKRRLIGCKLRKAGMPP